MELFFKSRKEVLSQRHQLDTIQNIYALFKPSDSFPSLTKVKHLGRALVLANIIAKEKWDVWLEKNEKSKKYMELKFFQKETETKPEARDILVDWLYGVDPTSKKYFLFVQG